MKPWEEYRQNTTMKPWEEYKRRQNNRAEDVLGGVTKFDDGYTFGFGRKLGGALNAIGSWPMDRTAQLFGVKNTPSFADRYNEIVGTADTAAQNFAERHPVSALGLEIGGSLFNPVNNLGMKYVNNAGNFGYKLARSAAIGGGTSVLNDIGRADNMQDFKNNLVKNTSIGAGLNAAFPLAGLGAKGIGIIGRKGLGWLTGTGESINQAFNAGKRGSKTFLDNISGRAPFCEVVDDAKTALNNLKIAKNTQYAQNMANIGKNVKNADIVPIRQNFNNLQNSFKYKGFSRADNATDAALKKLDNVLTEFENTPAAHDVIGLDALKQRVQDITFPLEQRKANYVVGRVANDIKSEISKQSPEYAKAMRNYTAASDEINELSRSLLGGGRKPNTATALGKMQRAYRNNAQSSYSRGQKLISTLDGENNAIQDALAGQALNSWLPRGGLGSSLGSLAGVAAVAHNPSALLAAPLFSPKVMGYMAYGAGRSSPYVGRALGKLNPAAVSAPFYKNY